MLRRRILASSMASVMALTSVVGVAFAADTDVTTKEGLKKYVESFNDFIKKDLDNYGTTAAEAFTDAIDHAKTIIAKSKPTAEECAAAYAMVEAMRNNLVQYDATDLAGLVAGYKDTYDENNILNKELEDHVYDEDAFADFVTAWEDGDYYKESDDLRLTTEAYTNLETAYNNLQAKKLDVVSKAEFRDVLKQYDEIIRKQSKYETWRRGKCTVNPSTSNKVLDTNGDEKGVKKLTDETYVTYGQLYDVIFGPSDGIQTADGPTADFNDHYAALRTAKLEGQEVDGKGGTAKYIYWDEGSDLADGANLDSYIRAAYDEFVAIKESRETSDEDIVNACRAAADAVKVYNGWQKDNVSSGSASSVKTLIKKYQERLAANFGSTDVLAALEELKGTSAVPTAATLTTENAKTGVKGFIKLGSDKNILGTYWFDGEVTAGTNVEGDDKSGEAGWKAIGKGTNILQYIEIEADDITGAPANAALTGLKVGASSVNVTKLGSAYKDAALYLEEVVKSSPAYATAAEAGDVLKEADELNLAKLGASSADADGDAAEWTIIYRALKYAFDDAYGSADATYTKKDIEKLMDDSYDLIDKTGDASVFWNENAALVDGTEAVQEWLKESDKLGKDYKDDVAVTYTAKHEVGAVKTGDIQGKNATAVYKALKTLKDALQKKYDCYAYSYEEIKDKIGKYYQAGIEGTEITGTKEFFEAVNRCAKALSVLEATNMDNEAFDDERNFNVHNRLLTKKDGTDKPNATEVELKEAYEALDAAYEAAKNAAKQEGTLVYDLNGDNVIDVLDCRELLTLTTAAEPADTAKYDYNDDDVVDVKDVRLLLEKSNEQ